MATRRNRLETELSRTESTPRTSAGRTLAWDLFVAYVAAWGVGIFYGAIIRASSTWNEGSAWERSMLRWFHAWTLPPWLDAVVLHLPLTGTNLTILPLTLAVGWWLWKRKNLGIIALQLLVVTAGSLSLNPTMKYLLGRDRPDLFPRRGMYNWASYPSGHSILTIAVYITVALLLYRSRGWRWPFVVAAVVFLANSYSRLYLAVHWPTDLVGGLLIGIVWLVGTWRAFTRHPAHRAALEAG
ncbi:MAG: phosphatase PAP2 family protein [Gemmatimonadaceae bacterium]